MKIGKKGAAWMHKELRKSNVVKIIQISQVCEKLISERICQTNKKCLTNSHFPSIRVLLFAVFYLFTEKGHLKINLL